MTNRRLWLYRAALVVFQAGVAALALWISRAASLVPEFRLTWSGIEGESDYAPWYYAALFGAYSTIAILLKRSRRRKWLPIAVMILWAALFPTALSQLSVALEQGLDPLSKSLGPDRTTRVWFGLTAAIPGCFTGALLWWALSSRTALVGALAASVVAASVFAFADPFGMADWSAVFWHTICAIGLSATLWPALPAGNRCPKCRYDLSGIDVPLCPECGTSLPPPRA